MKLTSDQPTEERATQLEVARRIALDQLAARQRSSKELRDALAKRNVPEDVAEEILQRFTAVGLLDDAAFAQALTQSRCRNGMRGKARIRQELREKGVDRETAEEAVAQLAPEDEYEAALALARRRAVAMARLEPHVMRRRLAGQLARRGFSGSVVGSVIAVVTDADPVEFSTGEQ